MPFFSLLPEGPGTGCLYPKLPAALQWEVSHGTRVHGVTALSSSPSGIYNQAKSPYMSVVIVII